jgi:hypothetical protein
MDTGPSRTPAETTSVPLLPHLSSFLRRRVSSLIRCTNSLQQQVQRSIQCNAILLLWQTESGWSVPGATAHGRGNPGFASRTFRNEGVVIRGDADPYSGEPYPRHPYHGYPGGSAFGGQPGLHSTPYDYSGQQGYYQRGHDATRASEYRCHVEAEKYEQELSRYLSSNEKWVHGDPWLTACPSKDTATSESGHHRACRLR